MEFYGNPDLSRQTVHVEEDPDEAPEAIWILPETAEAWLGALITLRCPTLRVYLICVGKTPDGRAECLEYWRHD